LEVVDIKGNFVVTARRNGGDENVVVEVEGISGIENVADREAFRVD